MELEFKLSPFPVFALHKVCVELRLGSSSFFSFFLKKNAFRCRFGGQRWRPTGGRERDGGVAAGGATGTGDATLEARPRQEGAARAGPVAALATGTPARLLRPAQRLQEGCRWPRPPRVDPSIGSSSQRPRRFPT